MITLLPVLVVGYNQVQQSVLGQCGGNGGHVLCRKGRIRELRWSTKGESNFIGRSGTSGSSLTSKMVDIKPVSSTGSIFILCERRN